MKRLNNKGFAISTVVYGLSIMGVLIVMIVMRSMASNRTNQKAISESIENELNKLSKSEIAFQALTPSVSGNSQQRFVVPDGASGWYKIQLWGAQGANGAGGLGAYTSGVIHLNAGDNLFIHVGNTTADGGEESDVRLVDGAYDDFNSYETRIMVAAGGGRDANAHGGTIKGYQNGRSTTGLSIALSGSKYSLVSGDLLLGKTTGTVNEVTESIANSSPKGTNGGGDGYFHSNLSSVGGVSYISGYGGKTINYKANTLNDNDLIFKYFKKNFDDTNGTWNYEASGTDYVFLDGVMKPGVKMGTGQAKIELVQATAEGETTTLTRRNQVLNNKRYVMVCKDSAASTFANSGWSHRLVVSYGNGTNAFEGTKTFTDGTKVDGRCKRYDLGGKKNINQITLMWNENEDARYSFKVSESSTAASAFQPVRTAADGIFETMTASGITVSAFQPNYVSSLPSKGNYIIQPITQESKVMVADGTNVSFGYLLDNAIERWSIEKNSDGTYKITNLSEYKDLGTDGTKAVLSNTPANWTITAVGDGTFTISTGGKLLQPYSTNNVFNLVTTANTSNNIARYRIYSTEYINYS